MDIKFGYDFDFAFNRANCWAKIEKEQPTRAVGSPPCTLFSRLQELNKSKVLMEKFPDRMQEVREVLRQHLRVPEVQGALLCPRTPVALYELEHGVHHQAGGPR